MCMKPMFKIENYPNKLILSISACGTNQNSITKAFQKEWRVMERKNSDRPSKYLFVFNEESLLLG